MWARRQMLLLPFEIAHMQRQLSLTMMNHVPQPREKNRLLADVTVDPLVTYLSFEATPCQFEDRCSLVRLNSRPSVLRVADGGRVCWPQKNRRRPRSLEGVVCGHWQAWRQDRQILRSTVVIDLLALTDLLEPVLNGFAWNYLWF
ncbi:hypothetical protein MTO96_047367 [Rhipicephalus appendiculatus]